MTVLRHTAQINGYGAPQRHELTGKDGKPLTLVQLLEAMGPIADEDQQERGTVGAAEIVCQKRDQRSDAVRVPCSRRGPVGARGRDFTVDKNLSPNRGEACHGVGKTFTIAVPALWWLAHYREGIVLTTSPTQRQVRTQLWSEIHRLVERAKVPYPKLKPTELKFRDDNNFAIGFSTNQAENFQGYHGKYVLIIADEAPGIESVIWDAMAGTMAGGKVHIVMAGNPMVSFGGLLRRGDQTLGLRSVPGLVAGQRKQLAQLAVAGAVAVSGSGTERAHQNGLA